MKAIAFIMLIFMVFISTAYGNGSHVNNVEKKCCHAMKNMPQEHQSKKACEGGMCVTMLSCYNCCFLKVERLSVQGTALVINTSPNSLYISDDLSGYNSSCWNPPKC
jgi:hypothetical protein